MHLHTPNFRALFLSIFWWFLLRGLFIYHSHWFIQHFTPKNMVKTHMFKGCEFLSPLQLHLHTPNFTVLFLSILWRILLRGLFIYHSHWFIQHFTPKNMVKMHMFKGCEFLSPLQQHLHTPNFTVLFLSIFWRFLLRGLFIYHSHWFIQHFTPKNMVKMHMFKGCEFLSPLIHLFILSKATYINQNESFIPLYILKVFNEGFIHLILYNSLLPKTWWFFFSVCWQYFLIYGVIKRDIQTLPWKKKNL